VQQYEYMRELWRALSNKGILLILITFTTNNINYLSSKRSYNN